MRVDEPEPGRVLTETDQLSSTVTTFTVLPEGSGCRVRIGTRWQGAGGVGGLFERLFAPRVLRRIYANELERLVATPAPAHDLILQPHLLSGSLLQAHTGT